jgi:hypothetical protein
VERALAFASTLGRFGGQINSLVLEKGPVDAARRHEHTFVLIDLPPLLVLCDERCEQLPN